jgi:hypothetical protein
MNKSREVSEKKREKKINKTPAFILQKKNKNKNRKQKQKQTMNQSSFLC